MTARGNARGHRIEFDQTAYVWRYADTGEVYDYERPCTLCRKLPTAEGHDACLGEIPGVLNACCGHGTAADGYIHYEHLPFWVTNQNRWPLAIFLAVAVPFLLFIGVMAAYGFTCDCDYAMLLLPWSGLFLLMLAGTAVARWVQKKQSETAVLILEKQAEALQR